MNVFLQTRSRAARVTSVPERATPHCVLIFQTVEATTLQEESPLYSRRYAMLETREIDYEGCSLEITRQLKQNKAVYC